VTERQGSDDEAAAPSWRRRWLALPAYTLAVAGLAAVFWHWVRGKSWDDSLAFALTVTVSAVGGQLLAAFIRRRAGRGDG
jgi:ferric-dicitrate binding protein FerR (iron transport regulator)